MLAATEIVGILPLIFLIVLQALLLSYLWPPFVLHMVIPKHNKMYYYLYPKKKKIFKNNIFKYFINIRITASGVYKA